jgi:hypothetical protein
VTADSASIRRFAGWSLVGGLSVATAAAILALLTGSFDDTDVRVIVTSIGFAFASATASSGAAARLRPSEALQTLGALTFLASVAAFVLLVVGTWTNMDEWGSEVVWRSFGCVAVAGVAGSHACLMLGARRRGDSEAVRALTMTALILAAVDALGAILPLADVVNDVDEAWGRIFGAGLVLLVLTSVLPPILRRIQPTGPPADSIASQMNEIADRIELLNSDPGNRAPEIRAEVKRLKNLAQSFEN